MIEREIDRQTDRHIIEREGQTDIHIIEKERDRQTYKQTDT